MRSQRKVLALGIDAAEPRLVLDLMARGELPALARLRDEGAWTDVRTPGHIGNTAVYPTFFTGTDPQRHGIYGGWPWSAEKMGVIPLHTDHLPPFWGAPADISMGMLDIPLAPHVGLSRGFEVTDWGGHYQMQRRISVSPPEMASAISGSHPFRTGPSLPRCGRGAYHAAHGCKPPAHSPDGIAGRRPSSCCCSCSPPRG